MGPQPDQLTQVDQQLSAVGIRAEDLEEIFVRSQGPGGQNVNKTASCVMLRHRPTGLSVKCQASRHQGINRVLARQILLEKIQRARHARLEAERSRREKIRRQKRPRSAAAKARMLADKARHARKKSLRGPVGFE